VQEKLPGKTSVFMLATVLECVEGEFQGLAVENCTAWFCQD